MDTTTIHGPSIKELARFWHAPDRQEAFGTATASPLEAVLLAGHVMKHIWQEKHQLSKKETRKPNVVIASSVSFESKRFASFSGVDCRPVPTSKDSEYRLRPADAMKLVDEDTIGVIVSLGSVYTGHYDPVKQMSDMLDKYEAKTGRSIPIHVDGASGAFVAPLATPDLKWDFQVSKVLSISTFGYTYELPYIGAWVVWRDQEYLNHLSQDLISGSKPPHHTYPNITLRDLEKDRSKVNADLKKARLLSRELEKSGVFHVLSEVHRTDHNPKKKATYRPGLPIVAFHFSDEFRDNNPKASLQILSTKLKNGIVTHHKLPHSLEKFDILRVVIGETKQEATSVAQYIIEAAKSLTSRTPVKSDPTREGEDPSTLDIWNKILEYREQDVQDAQGTGSNI